MMRRKPTVNPAPIPLWTQDFKPGREGQVNFRMSANELAIVDMMAQRLGLPNRSAVIREALSRLQHQIT